MPKYDASRDLPLAVKVKKTMERKILAEYLSEEFKEKVTPGSIGTWFSRNKDVKEKLTAYLKEQLEIDTLIVTEEMLELTYFKEFDMVKKYRMGKTGKVVRTGINGHVSKIRNFCLGIRPNIDPETGKQYMTDKKKELKKFYKSQGIPESEIKFGVDLKKHGWRIRHPERITQKDMKEYEFLMETHYPSLDKEYGSRVDMASTRMSVRNWLIFFKQPNDLISGKKSRTAGSLKYMTITKEQVQQIFDYLRESSRGFTDPYYQAYVAIKFIYQTGTRITATLNAELKDMRLIEGEDAMGNMVQLGNITVLDKGQKTWQKKVTKELYYEIKNAAGKGATGIDELFRITEDELRAISRECIKKFAPEIIREHPLVKVVHFWRHIMGQHMLEATNWNYGIVAAMGGWQVKSLEESYGAAGERKLIEFGAKYLPMLMRDLEEHE